MKKIFCILTSVLIIVTLLSGCVSDRQDNSKSEKPTVESLDPAQQAVTEGVDTSTDTTGQADDNETISESGTNQQTTEQPEQETEEETDPPVEDTHEEELDDGLAAGSL